MIEILTGWAINYGIQVAAGGIAVFIGGWIIKKIPFDRFAKWAESVGRKQGEAVTRFFNNWKPTKAIYEKIIEPVIIDTVNALLFGWVKGFIGGLKSDNKKE